MQVILYYFLLFIIYSILGWCIEVTFCSIPRRKLTSRGFLIGPYCPIYGSAAIIMILSLKRYINDPIVIFIMGALIASILEYITSYAMEKLYLMLVGGITVRKNLTLKEEFVCKTHFFLVCYVLF